MEIINGLARFTSDSPVAQNLLRKNDLMEAGNDHQSIRPVIIAGGGGMQGIFQAAFLGELQKLRLLQLMDGIGHSVGGANLAYARADQEHLMIGIYEHLLSEGKFFNPTNLRQPIDVDWLMHVFAGKRDPNEKLDLEKAKNCPSGFWLTMTDVQTGQTRYVDAKDPNHDLLQVMKASLSIPFLYHKQTEFDGAFYMDDFSDNLAIDWAIDRLNPTDLILLLNDSTFIDRPNYSFAYRSLEKAAAKLYFRGQPHLQRAYLGKIDRIKRKLELLRNQDGSGTAVVKGRRINVAVAYRDGKHDFLFTRNSQKLKEWEEQGKLQAVQALGG